MELRRGGVKEGWRGEGRTGWGREESDRNEMKEDLFIDRCFILLLCVVPFL